MDVEFLNGETVIVEHVGVLHADEDRNHGSVEFGGKFESSGLERPGLFVVKPHCLLRVDQNLLAAVKQHLHARKELPHCRVVGA